MRISILALVIALGVVAVVFFESPEPSETRELAEIRLADTQTNVDTPLPAATRARPELPVTTIPPSLERASTPMVVHAGDGRPEDLDPEIAPLSQEQLALEQMSVEAANTAGIPTTLADALRIRPEITDSFERERNPAIPKAPEARADYEYGLIPRIEHCLAGRIESKGYIHGLLKFRRTEAGFIGTGFEPRRLGLSDAENSLVLDCIEFAHLGFPLRIDPGNGRSVYGMGFMLIFPIERNQIYRALESGIANEPLLDRNGNLIP